MDASPPDQPDARIAALAQDLRRVAGKLKRRLREQAAASDLTPSQTAVMLRLEKDGPATTSALARAEGMRPQSMGAVVAALDAAGLVQGAPDPEDGRKTLLSLTEACRTMIAEGRAARQDWLTRTLAARFSAKERERIAELLGLLGRLVDG